MSAEFGNRGTPGVESAARSSASCRTPIERLYFFSPGPDDRTDTKRQFPVQAPTLVRAILLLLRLLVDLRYVGLRHLVATPRTLFFTVH